jgi:hypothetical protein
MKFTHRKLCEDLAQTKGTKFIEVCLGASGNTQIADVISITPRQFKNFMLTIYECKVSRSDFLSDIKSEKYKGYLEYCNKFYFATLPGIVKIEEIPKGIGLMTRDESKGWIISKNAKKNDIEIPRDILLSLLFKKLSQDDFERRQHVLHYATENNFYFNSKEKFKKILSPKVRKALKFYEDYHYRINDLLKIENEFYKRNDTNL